MKLTYMDFEGMDALLSWVNTNPNAPQRSDIVNIQSKSPYCAIIYYWTNK